MCVNFQMVIPFFYSSHSSIIRVRICTLNDSGNFCEIPSRSTAQSRRLQKKKTTVREFTAKTMSQLLWENAMTGDQSNKKEFGTYTLYQVVFTTAMGHYAHTQAHT